MNQQKIGKFIKERRKEKHLTQEQLAELLRVSNRTVSKWENGNSIPDYAIFNDLCKELDISIDELFAGEKLENYKQLEDKFKKDKIKKKKRNIIIVLILLFIFILLYKVFVYYYFTTRSTGNFSYNDNIDYLSINYNNKDNTTIDNMRIYIPEEFELVTDFSKSHFVKNGCYTYIKNLNDDKEFDAAIIVCNNDFDNIINLDHYGINNSLFPYLDVSSTLEKNNIKDTLDLLKYYQKHQNDKINIFTSNNKIKMNYISKEYVTQSLSSYDKFYYLEKDLYGYLLETKGRIYNTTIYYDKDNNKESYNISLINNKINYFHYDNALEIVESMQIE